MTFKECIRRSWCPSNYYLVRGCDTHGNSGEKGPFRLGRGMAQRGEGNHFRDINSDSDGPELFLEMIATASAGSY